MEGLGLSQYDIHTYEINNYLSFCWLHITSRSVDAAWWNCVLLCKDSKMLLFFDQVSSECGFCVPRARSVPRRKTGKLFSDGSGQHRRKIVEPQLAVLAPRFSWFAYVFVRPSSGMRSAKLSCISSIHLHPPRHEFTMKNPRRQAVLMTSSCGTPSV